MGKLEDASEDWGSSSGIAAASKSYKNFLILSWLRLLQVALISKSIGIKSPSEDLLCIQEQHNIYLQIPHLTLYSAQVAYESLA